MDGAVVAVDPDTVFLVEAHAGGDLGDEAVGEFKGGGGVGVDTGLGVEVTGAGDFDGIGKRAAGGGAGDEAGVGRGVAADVEDAAPRRRRWPRGGMRG